jgi:hypothetical protein
MADYRILVTGSRDWTDVPAVYDALAQAVAEAPHRSAVIVHGACPKGADAIARLWIRMRPVEWGRRVSAEAHPADWDTWGKAAGFRRNAAMVALGADLCLAFYKQGAGNRGTDHCARLAEKAGIPVRRITDVVAGSAGEAGSPAPAGRITDGRAT